LRGCLPGELAASYFFFGDLAGSPLAFVVLPTVSKYSLRPFWYSSSVLSFCERTESVTFFPGAPCTYLYVVFSRISGLVSFPTAFPWEAHSDEATPVLDSHSGFSFVLAGLYFSLRVARRIFFFIFPPVYNTLMPDYDAPFRMSVPPFCASDSGPFLFSRCPPGTSFTVLTPVLMHGTLTRVTFLCITPTIFRHFSSFRCGWTTTFHVFSFFS